ncbi:hypothetical protein B0H16DRAFT_1744832 [Mycena metata]|uniref:Helicase ATP-binding domain-containing protein n=1 Tax=Mycena metata TaxID=1033252 RepID=A0AAD7MD48_9AGAR|nr:hypothetical protein B0H16DRAFT_1744832 [Mycena metata]
MPVTFSGASGARGREFADTKIENGVRPRGIFVEANGRVWIVTCHGKTEGQTDAVVFIPSMLPTAIGKILLTYLVVIRPGIMELAHIYYDAHTSMLYRQFLWVANNKLLDSDNLTALLRPLAGFGLQPWCQVVVEIYRVYLGSENQVYEDEDEQDIFAARMGHTLSTTRRHYGVEVGSLPFLSSDLLNRFRSASILHHQPFGLLPGADEILPLSHRLRLNTCRVEAEGGPTTQTVVADIIPQLTQLIQKLGAELSGNLAQNIVQNTLPLPLFPVGANTDGPRFSSPSPAPMELDVAVPLPLSPPARIAQSTPMLTESTVPVGTVTVDGRALLRDFLEMRDADWKSDKQEEGVRLALARQDNFILVLNVGEGKSLAYQLPAYHEQSLWSLVVCPNKSLLNDQLESCRKLGLSAMQWYTRDSERPIPPHTNVLFVALETAGAPKFGSFVLGRAQWPKTQYLRALPVQQIFASATLALRTMKQFRITMALPPSIPVVRSYFVQPQMRFMILELEAQTTNLRRFLNDLQALLKKKYMGTNGQGIIFRSYKQDILDHWDPKTPTSASFNGWKDHLEHETLWLQHETTWIMTTSTFIHGINNLDCNVVILVDFHPSNLLQGQGIGRAGRNGQVIFIKSIHVNWILPHSLDAHCGENIQLP